MVEGSVRRPLLGLPSAYALMRALTMAIPANIDSVSPITLAEVTGHVTKPQESASAIVTGLY